MATTKQQALKVLNPVIGVLLVTQAGTGIFHDGIPYEIFGKIHGPIGYALAAGAVTHVALNWNWFKTAFFAKKKRIKSQ